MGAELLGAGLIAVGKPPPDDKVSPGLIGFLVTFGLVLATILLMRSMVGHLRKVRYSPDPAERMQPSDAEPPRSHDDARPTSEPEPPESGETP